MYTMRHAPMTARTKPVCFGMVVVCEEKKVFFFDTCIRINLVQFTFGSAYVL